MRQDVRFAFRLLRRNPGFAVAAVITIALGVGLNGAVFALVRSVLLRPLPFRDPDRVVVLWQPRSGGSGTFDPSDAPQTVGAFEDWRTYNRSLDGIAAVNLWKHNSESRFDLIASDRAERLRGGFVTPNFFTLLGVQAAIGRVFSQEDPIAVQSEVAVIGDGLWRRLFAGDAGVIGRRVRMLGGSPRRPMDVTIIGVLPEAFRYSYPDETEIWVPLTEATLARQPRRALEYQIIARLKPGFTSTAAGAELSGIESRIGASDPQQSWRAQFGVIATPFREGLTRAARPLLTVLGFVAAIVLLIACANVSNLLVARGVVRGREIAVRTAIGATRARLLRQAIVECAVLGGLGGAAGLAVLALGLPVGRVLIPASMPRGDELRIDPWVVGVCVAAALAAILIGALAAFLVGSARSPVAVLKESSAGLAGAPRAAVWRKAVVGVQVALVFALLVTASLLIQSFWKLSHAHLGYDGSQVLTMEIRALGPEASDAHVTQVQRRLLEAVHNLPGVTDAAITSAVPLRGTDWTRHVKVSPGAGEGAREVVAHERQVSPDYFSLLRIPLVGGRLFDDRDTDASPQVAIVSASLARTIAPAGSAVGRWLKLDHDTEIVGVVGDVRTDSIALQAAPAYYLPRAQAPSELMCLVIRTAPGQTAGVAAAARSAIHRVDPQQPVERVTTLDRIAADSIADRRFDAAIVGAFSGIALLLAIVGLAGVVARSIVERVREMAVRAALGADAARLRRMIVGQTLRPVAIGLTAGALVAWWLTAALQTQLFEVGARDPLTFGGALLLMTTVAAMAAYVPARAATRVNPMEALRAE